MPCLVPPKTQLRRECFGEQQEAELPMGRNKTKAAPSSHHAHCRIWPPRSQSGILHANRGDFAAKRLKEISQGGISSGTLVTFKITSEAAKHYYTK